MTPEQLYLFHEGTWYHSYQCMGAHRATEDGEEGVRFTVWAQMQGRWALPETGTAGTVPKTRYIGYPIREFGVGFPWDTDWNLLQISYHRTVWRNVLEG